VGGLLRRVGAGGAPGKPRPPLRRHCRRAGRACGLGVVRVGAQGLTEQARSQLVQIRTVLKASHQTRSARFFVSAQGHHHQLPRGERGRTQAERHDLVCHGRGPGAGADADLDVRHDGLVKVTAPPPAEPRLSMAGLSHRNQPWPKGRMYSLGNPLDVGFA